MTNEEVLSVLFPQITTRHDFILNCASNKWWNSPYKGGEQKGIEKLLIAQKKCKDCKWWKDSDGTYRRGVKAESKCPINTVSVANGWGYCYMFEPQERSDKE